MNDGSRDDTLARLRSFAGERIDVRGQVNAGFAPTMIRLCAEADTEFVAVAGAGDEDLPHDCGCSAISCARIRTWWRSGAGSRTSTS
ncbi:hypothetical protein AB5I41_17390 [Sphingomonas sp. MMS24-JH45]